MHKQVPPGLGEMAMANGASRLSAKSALEEHMHRLVQRLAEAEALYREIDWDHLSQAADEALWAAFIHLPR